MNEYKDDVTTELCYEVKHLKSNHSANLVLQDADEQLARTLKPLDLVNKLWKLNLKNLFSNCCVAHHMFCTLPVTVAEGKRCLKSLALIKKLLAISSVSRLQE